MTSSVFVKFGQLIVSTPRHTHTRTHARAHAAHDAVLHECRLWVRLRSTYYFHLYHFMCVFSGQLNFIGLADYAGLDYRRVHMSNIFHVTNITHYFNCFPKFGFSARNFFISALSLSFSRPFVERDKQKPRKNQRMIDHISLY